LCFGSCTDENCAVGSSTDEDCWKLCDEDADCVELGVDIILLIDMLLVVLKVNMFTFVLVLIVWCAAKDKLICR